MPAAWVYLLRCRDGSLYTGWTVDLGRRLARHRAGRASRYTARRLPVELAAAMPMRDRASARREEARIKRLPRAAKLARLERADIRGTGSDLPYEHRGHALQEVVLALGGRVASPARPMMWSDVIDSLRQQIQQRLDQLAGEADRLRTALAALDPRLTPSPARTASARTPKAAKPSPRPTAAGTGTATKRPRAAVAKSKAGKPAATSAPTRRARTPSVGSLRATAPGATKAAVLGAFGDEPLTGGQVAEKTGLSRPTVSTTLARLAKSGEVQKAERGYRIVSAAGE